MSNSNTVTLILFDSWLAYTGPSALVVREPLMSIEGKDGVVFPATYAASKDKTFKGGYNIDKFPDGTNVCLLDSVGSQANRIEPLFIEEPYNALVPQVTIKAGEKVVNLLNLGHRAGDAFIRCSVLSTELHDAFKAVLKGNMGPMAKIAPTTLVFGAWDSRDTQGKLPRLLSSTIRAFNVRQLTRSAQFNPAIPYVEDGLLDKPANGAASDSYAERGFIHVPSSGGHGGVIADGGIRRDMSLHLSALRMLSDVDKDKTLALRRYILGLSLTALTNPPTGYLRQGCDLVTDPDQPLVFDVIHRNGRKETCKMTHEDALAYARVTAKAYGVGPDRAVNFDKDMAKKDLAESKNAKKAAAKKEAVETAE